MATLLLQAAAQVATQVVASRLFASDNSRHREGARLEELSVQTSTYGAFIPLVYGNVRIAGNVIWSLPIREVATTTTVTQGKGGGSSSSSSTEYSYYVTLAIAICTGEVDTIERVWADARQLDLGLGTYRFYKGSEAQLPDTLIESYEGLGTTPAYRGLCYVVIEDFPLAEYGNRIPNFTFEVKKRALWPDVDGESVENMVREMVLIPGSGEFVYDTQIQHKVEGEEIEGVFAQSGEQTRINRHTPYDKANALVALDDLAATCPNVQWVALVVNWFGTSMDLSQCSILPGIEFAENQATTQPETWSVGGFARGNAHSITYVDGTPRYGGTPDDQSVLRLCDELITRGKKILFLPLFLMDTEDKPWRGRLTGSQAEVSDFFTRTNGYNAYVLHYANLLKDKVEAFAIGSELRGLTEVHDGATINRHFPGVSALISLAAAVKGIVGSEVKVTYAADWSEYHHTQDGWYHMDPLWASPHIDVIGIDAYFPLTDAPQSNFGYDIELIKQGWQSGEGYDFYYTDASRETQAPLAAPYAWKNIEWFWKNTHTNPDGNVTAWAAESKKIWFTEFGFPSVDAATNQPNVFYDPTSSESFFPYLSNGQVDVRAQRAGVAATLSFWAGSNIVEKLFLWTWDARPYPYWPDLLSVWADGGVWATGHWVQGKFGLSALAAIVADLAQRAGVRSQDLDVSRLSDRVDGFIVKRQATARALIEQLMDAYFFDTVETDGKLKCVPRGNAASLNVPAGDLLPTGEQTGQALQITRLQELELPRRVAVNYLNRLALYQTGTQIGERQVVESTGTETLDLPLVMSDQQAKAVAEVALYQGWLGRTRFAFDLPMAYADLEPAEVVTVNDAAGNHHECRITQLQLGKAGRVRIEAVAEDVSSYAFASPPAAAQAATTEVAITPTTRAEIIELPVMPGASAEETRLHVAAAGLASGWAGAAIYRSDDGGSDYRKLLSVQSAATMGTVKFALMEGPRNRIDYANSVEVVLLGQASLSSVTELAILNGANLALVGDEIIQFRRAELLGGTTYRLSELLRGRLGTEAAMQGHSAGERFILLDSAISGMDVPGDLLGLARHYKTVSIGKTLGTVEPVAATYQGRALKPFAPVHVRGERDSSGNLTIRWVRRARAYGHWRDGGDIPLVEAAERYRLRILNGLISVREVDVSSAEYHYSQSAQASDFGSPQASVTVEVAQLSDRVGAGEPVSASV